MTSKTRLYAIAVGTFALSCSLSLCSQTPAKPVKTPPVTIDVNAPSPGGTKVDYSRESGIIERMDTVYRYTADGNGTKEVTAVIHLQDEAAIKGWSVLSFSFASSAEHVEIDYVRVRRPDGTVVETPAGDAQEMPAPITREAPFYSDIKEKQIPVRSLRAGDHLEYKLRIVRTRPEAPGHFWGEESFFTPANGIVVFVQTMQIRLPKAAYIQVWSPGHEAHITETETEKVYDWHSAQTTPIAGLDKAAIKRLQAESADEEGKLPAIAWTNFHDWAEVGAWYRGMEGTRMAPDADVKAKVAELIAGKNTPEEKIRALYGYVGPQIRYIGVAFGVGRYQPHESGDVLRNQYGDCKDKHTLLAAMLSEAGFTADAALIGSGVRFNEDVPSPGSFNHVITVVQLDGKPIWLDATAEVAPYRMLMPSIRDKQALLIPDSGTAHIARTPKDLPFKPEIHFDAEGTLDELGTSHSHFVMVMRGDEEVLYRHAVRTVSPAQWDELMQNISRAMSYSGKVTHAEFSRADDTTEPFRVSYDYEREKNGDWDNYRILPQLPPAGLAIFDDKDPPVSSFDVGTVHVETDRTVMKLPPGWGAELPENIHAKSAFATLDKTYKLEDGSLITTRRVEVLQQKVPLADWKEYQRWAKEASLDGEAYIQLTRNGSGHHSAAVDNPKASEIIREVAQLEKEHSWDDARKKLDEAKALNPKQAYLWSNYGYLDMVRGKFGDAADAFRRELSEHPDEDNVSMLLAQVLLQQHKSPDAIATLETLVAHNPGNDNATNMLVSLLMADKQYSVAEKTLRDSLTAHPDNIGTQLSLGTALLRQGKKDDARAVLKSIAEKADDPIQLNNASYALADENLDLSLAETAARRALTLIEEQVANAQSDEAEQKTLLRSEMLLNIWDTLGWTLFREGKTAEAESLINAAWTNSLAAEPGYHLGVIYEKEGQAAKAMAVYQIALFGDKGDTSDVVANNNLERQDALRKAGTAKQVSDGKKALQAQRTFKVPGPNDNNGYVTIEIDLSAKGASNARVVKDEKNLATLPAAVMALNNIDFKSNIPAGSHAKLVRRGILSCHSGNPCELVLLSSRDALLAANK